MFRYTNNFADGELHYHHCPECYEAKPCRMGCAHEPDLDDPPRDPRGRKFGASCDSAVCDDCLREAAEREEAEYEALARKRAETPDHPVGALFDRLLNEARCPLFEPEPCEDFRKAQEMATFAFLTWLRGEGPGSPDLLGLFWLWKTEHWEPLREPMHLAPKGPEVKP